jgi:hypothetical protein
LFSASRDLCVRVLPNPAFTITRPHRNAGALPLCASVSQPGVGARLARPAGASPHMDRLQARLALRGVCKVTRARGAASAARQPRDSRYVWLRAEPEDGGEPAPADAAPPASPARAEQARDDAAEPDEPPPAGEDALLVDALRDVAREFRDARKPYRARAAEHAVALVRDGRADDINPGLWSHVAKWERLRDSRGEAAMSQRESGR